MVAEFDRRRQVVTEGLNALPERLGGSAQGRVLRLPQHLADRLEGEEARLRAAGGGGVATIGGPDFGVHGEGYIRLSYANSTENIRKALGPDGRIPR